MKKENLLYVVSNKKQSNLNFFNFCDKNVTQEKKTKAEGSSVKKKHKAEGTSVKKSIKRKAQAWEYQRNLQKNKLYLFMN